MESVRLTTSNPERARVFVRGYGDGKLFALSLVAALPGTQNEVDNAACFWLRGHLKQQVANVKKSLRHEVRNTPEWNQNEAIDALHYRTLEPYYCWVEKHRMEPISTGNQFAEMLLFRVMGSMAEHIMHCPERLVQVLHGILAEKLDNMEGGYVIDLEELQRGLPEVHASVAPVINFDDINQCASGNTRRLRKSWHESSGVCVVLDILRNYYPVLFLKGWIFAAVLYLRAVNDTGTADFNEFWGTAAKIDSCLYCAVELILFLYSFFVQERGQSWMRRAWQRGVSAIFGVACFLWIWAPLGLSVYKPAPLIATCSYFGIGRLFFCVLYLPVIERWLGRDRNFVKDGRPRWARRQRMAEQLAGHRPRVNFEEEELLRTSSSASCSVIKNICCTPFRSMRLINFQSVLYWLGMLLVTVVFEYYIVAPVGSRLSYRSLCTVPCTDVHTFALHQAECNACMLSVATVTVLMWLSSLVDLYFIFNLVLSLWGFFKGKRRGLAHTFSLNASYLSLSLERTGTTRIAFERLFGTWKRAKMVWSLVCLSLYKRDLIDAAMTHDLSSIFEVGGRDNKEGRAPPIHPCLSRMGPEPRHLIMFFLKTVRVLGAQAEQIAPFEAEETEQEFLHSVPTLSQLLTTYAETILQSTEFLRTLTGDLANLQHLIKKHPQEWLYFEQRMLATKLYIPRGNANSRLLTDFLSQSCWLSEDVVDEVRLWASYRSQTVARTIRGALVYHDALKVRLGWLTEDLDSDEEKTGEARFGLKLKLADLVELIVSAQTYGGQGNEAAQERRRDLEFVLRRFKEYPISVVYDFEADKAVWKDEAEVRAFWERHPSIAGEDILLDDEDSVHVASQEEEGEEGQGGGDSKGRRAKGAGPLPFRYATLVKRMNKEGELEVVSVMPRRYPLRIGQGAHKTQGKAANHLNACRALWGHVTQVLDANMDGFIAEGFKLPFITHNFLSRRNAGANRNEYTQRKNVNHRVIGFRELIFTHRMGYVGASMASSESTFGTIYQRVLDDPLGVRMHYGHPDFFDTFWIHSRGGPSKASPRINLSEDVFAGFNVWLRGEDTAHCDTLEWQKGRETVFTTASMFLTKISAGCVGMLRTRDMMDMNSGLDILSRLSLYTGGTCFFLTQLFLTQSLLLYAIVFFLFALAGIKHENILELDTSLSAEWVLGFGVSAAMPFLAEMILERGIIGGVWYWVKEILPSTAFYFFQNQAVAASVWNGILTGEASYINTGRPSFFTAYKKSLCYMLYARSHYYPALTLLWFYSFRAMAHPASWAESPLILVIGTALWWLVGPILFCPSGTHLSTIKACCKDAFYFLFSMDSNVSKAATKDNLFMFWKKIHRRDHALDAIVPRVMNLILLLLPFTLLACVTRSRLHNFVGFVILMAFHFILTLCWQLSCRKVYYVTLVWMLFPLALVLALPFIGLKNLQALDLGELDFIFLIEHWGPMLLVRMGIFFLGVRIVFQAALLFASLLLKTVLNCAPKARKTIYQSLVDASYYYGFYYHTHFYLCCVVFILQTSLQSVQLFVGLCGRYGRRCHSGSKNDPSIQATTGALPAVASYGRLAGQTLGVSINATSSSVVAMSHSADTDYQLLSDA